MPRQGGRSPASAESRTAGPGTRASALAAWLRDGMNTGALSFPLTPFTVAGDLDLEAFRQHVRRQLAARPGALFACCGTGEFFSLSEPEYAELVQAAVHEVAGDVPVLAGVGYGWGQAGRFASLAEIAGADGLLVHPHYLVEAPQQGLVEHVRQLAARTPLPLLLYQRGSVRYTASSAAELAMLPTVIGLKDGHGNFDQLQRIKLAVPADFVLLNGSPTAEIQVRAYAGVGIPAYSSSVRSFAPEIATAFFQAFHGGDHDLTERLLSSFYCPLAELRDRRAGYAVALIKAAARLRGEPVGPVRAPLADPGADDLAVLERIVRAGLDIVGAPFSIRPDRTKGQSAARHSTSAWLDACCPHHEPQRRRAAARWPGWRFT